MNEKLLTQLAAALEVEPEAILDYSPEADGGYCVILDTFKKYRSVRPMGPKTEYRKRKAKTEK